MSSTFFDIRRDTLYKIPLRLIGVKASSAYVELHPDELRVCFGRYRERFAYADLVDVEPIPWKGRWGIGVRWVDRTIAYVGSTQGVIAFRLREPRKFRVLVELEADRVAVSAADPNGLIEALRARIAAA